MAAALPAGVPAKHLVALGHQSVGIQCDGITELDGSEVVLPQGSVALVRGLVSFELPRGRSSFGAPLSQGSSSGTLGRQFPPGGGGTQARSGSIVEDQRLAGSGSLPAVSCESQLLTGAREFEHR